MKQKKQLTYNQKKILFTFGDVLLVVLGGLSGFLGYEIKHSWNNFNKSLADFKLFEHGVKLNLLVAFPLLIALAISFAVILKKNKDFFKTHITLDILIATLSLYLAYAIIEVCLTTLIGILIGESCSEFILQPIKNKVLKNHEQKADIEQEKAREKARVQARQELKAQAEKELRQLRDGVEY